MPIYEYQCKDCGHELDKLQKFSDPPLTLCPDCGQDALQKLISQSSFHLKGSGWYVTDYKKGGNNGSNGSNGSKAAAKTESSDSATSASPSTSTPKSETKGASATSPS